MKVRSWHGRSAGAATTSVFLGACLLWAAPTRAQECAIPPGAAPTLGQQSVALRLRFIRQSLHDTAQLERRYLLGWSLSYVGMAAGSWVLVPFSREPQALLPAAIWNSATALAGALLVTIEPLQVIRTQRRLETLLTQGALPSCAVLAQAERSLAQVAAKEISARSARAHILSFFTNVGLGLVLGYGLQRPEAAALNTTIGVFVGELMIATRPTLAPQRLASYQRGNLDTPPPSVRSLALSGNSLPIGSGYGVGLGGVF